MKLQTFGSNYFCGKSHFEDDGTQHYLACQPVDKYFKQIVNSNHISVWKSNELSDENIKSPATSNNSLAPVLNYITT